MLCVDGSGQDCTAACSCPACISPEVTVCSAAQGPPHKPECCLLQPPRKASWKAVQWQRAALSTLLLSHLSVGDLGPAAASEHIPSAAPVAPLCCCGKGRAGPSLSQPHSSAVTRAKRRFQRSTTLWDRQPPPSPAQHSAAQSCSTAQQPKPARKRALTSPHPSPTPPCPLPTALSATSHSSGTPSRMGTPSPPCAAVPLQHHSLEEKFPLISNLNLPWCNVRPFPIK